MFTDSAFTNEKQKLKAQKKFTSDSELFQQILDKYVPNRELISTNVITSNPVLSIEPPEEKSVDKKVIITVLIVI